MRSRAVKPVSIVARWMKLRTISALPMNNTTAIATSAITNAC